MKTMKFLGSIFLLSFILLFTITGTALANSQDCGSLLLGDTCVLRSGHTLKGDLLIFGGSATLESESTVTGNIVLMGGSLEAHGMIDGDIVSTGGFVHLYDGANVKGDIVRVGGNVVQDSGAIVQGDIITSTSPGNVVTDLDLENAISQNVFRPVGNFFRSTFSALAFAIIAIIVALIAPKGNERLAKTISSRFALSLGMGTLGMLVIALGSIILSVTIIGIPIAVLVLLAFTVALFFGWFGLGLEIGNLVAKLFKTTWSTPIAIGIGTLVLSLGCAAIGWVPCLGQLVVFVAVMVGFGAVVLTRFGTRLPEGVKEVNVPPTPPSFTIQEAISSPSATETSSNIGRTQMMDEETIKKMVKKAGEEPITSPKPEEPLPPTE
jgi:cytoskeletal protein CcmA (bactofilin family)